MIQDTNGLWKWIWFNNNSKWFDVGTKSKGVNFKILNSKELSCNFVGSQVNQFCKIFKILRLLILWVRSGVYIHNLSELFLFFLFSIGSFIFYIFFSWSFLSLPITDFIFLFILFSIDFFIC